MGKSRQAANRREFISRLGLTAAAARLSPGEENNDAQRATESASYDLANLISSVDFRYAPVRQQMTTCFPDDPHKSLVGENGELRLGHPGMGGNIDAFRMIAEFSLLGMEPDVVRIQKVEAPGIPIVHTRIDRPEAYLQMTVFSSREQGEGRVDNVLLEIKPRTAKEVAIMPIIVIKTGRAVKTRALAVGSAVSDGEKTDEILLVADSRILPGTSSVAGNVLMLEHAIAGEQNPARYFLRFPREAQTAESLEQKLQDPQSIIENVRSFWREWKPFEGEVSWRFQSRYHEFLIACTRNIQQAREVKNGQLTFQVGPTVYRGLWVVDGQFILEAARYLGYDREAQRGLETTWGKQEKSGAIFAGGGREHWKDTGIALFSLVRQAELSQNYDYLREMQPSALRAIGFLKELRERAKHDGSPNGRYGLLPPGFADGGLSGPLSELTNTLWVLAGLRAYLDAASRLKLSGLDQSRAFYEDLRTSFARASKLEMKRYPVGFEYLPMAVKEDSIWKRPDPWDLPQPQAAQWALSQAIFPGLVFEPDDPVVQGHIKLMQACTREDVPVETGWLAHGGLWTYNAPFVAEVYLWAGLADLARRTFHGFLNHATPTYCWREEQPLKGSLTALYVGDMPHNWASAECIRYLRHILVLEDGANLRLLAGIGDPELAAAEPIELRATPTRFGRVDLVLEPLNNHAGWRATYKRHPGPMPGKVLLPTKLGRRFNLSSVSGAETRRENEQVWVDTRFSKWEAIWKA